jgi:hypothetical protein
MIFLLLRFEQHHGRDIRQEAEAWDLGQVKDGLEQVHRAGGHQGGIADTQQRKGWVRTDYRIQIFSDCFKNQNFRRQVFY